MVKVAESGVDVHSAAGLKVCILVRNQILMLNLSTNLC